MDAYLLFYNRKSYSPQISRSHMYLAAETTLYIVHLRIELTKKEHENSSVGLILCKDMNRAFVDYVIRDYNKPLGVVTYSTSKDMPERMRKALPDIDELKKVLILSGSEKENG